VKVTAVSEFGRKYSWGNSAATFELAPRSRRWYGSIGIGQGYLPSKVSGLSHVVLEEFQVHYHSSVAAARALKATNASDAGGFKTYWTRDGLTAEFHLQHVGGSTILGAWVTQVCVKGQKPRGLPGATPTFALRDAQGKLVSTLPCAHVDESGYIDTWPKDQGFRDER
jgi:hypothetical protein